MPTTTGVTNTQSSTPTPSGQTAFTGATNGLGKDAFLKLLIAQLRNQDPMKPMEDKEFIAQLAQFSSLETLQSLEKRFDSMLLSQSIDQAAGLIGRQVEAQVEGINGTIELVTGNVSEVRMASGTPMLLIGSREVSLGQVVRVLA